MYYRLLTLHPMWKLARSSLVLALLILGSAYALLGDEVFCRIGAQIDRAGYRISDATTQLHLRTVAAKLDSSNDLFERLLGFRETLNQEIRATQEQRDIATCRLEEDGRVLRNIMDVLEGKVTASAEDLTRPVVEKDAALVLGQLQARQSEIEKCDFLLSRMKEDLARLQQEIERAYGSLRQRVDDLARRKTSFAEQKAYRDGLNLARQLNNE